MMTKFQTSSETETRFFVMDNLNFCKMVQMSTATECSILVGRVEEVQTLFQAFQRSLDVVDGDNSSQEFVLIHGRSGSGKTTLANNLRREVVHQHHLGFFLSGKFELTTVQNPYAVFASAFHQFVDEIFAIEKNNIGNLLVEVQDAVGTEGKLITDIIPSLERLIGRQTDQCDIHGINAVHRFPYLFCKICRAISTIAPLVLFLDDLQWSDLDSRQLLLKLLQSHRTGHNSALLVVTAFRNEAPLTNDGDCGRQLPTYTHFLQDLENTPSLTKINTTTILLDNLDQTSTHQLISKFLNIPLERGAKLADDIYFKSHGSPFHTLQILNDLAANESCLNLVEMNQGLAEQGLNKPMNELVCDHLKSLPVIVQKVLKVSACLGDEVDESAVCIGSELDLAEVQEATRIATESGHLVFCSKRGLYRFSHDQIRQEVLLLIDDIEAVSFYIGYSLWTQSSPLFLSSKMFVVANLLNHGTKLLTDKTDRYRAAALNLEAGIKAASLANFADSSRYLRAGIDFLKGGDYWMEQYHLTLSLFIAAADTEVCTQHFDRVTELVQEVIDHARTLHDKIPAHVARINSLCQSGSVQQAINIAIEVLQQLGEPLPYSATKGTIVREIVKTKLLMFGRSYSDMMSLRQMENKDKLHAMHIMTVIVPYAFQIRSFYNPLMATRMVRLCMKYGFHKSAAIGLATYSVVMCRHDRKEGYRLGSLALSMVERLRAKEMIPRVTTFFYGFMNHWKCPVRNSLEPLKRAADAAMEIGDVECAMWALHIRGVHLLACACPLSQVENEFMETAQQMQLYKQDHMLKLVNLTLEYIRTVRINQFHDPTELPYCVLDDPSDAVTEPNNSTLMSDYVLVQFSRLAGEANVALRFGDYERADQLLKKQRKLNYEHVASFNSCTASFVEGLVAAASARRGHEKRINSKIARRVWKQMKSWAVDCPDNFLCKQQLLQAEIASLKPHKGVNVQTKALYDEAIAGAAHENFVQQAALACDLAGNYMHRQGNAALAKQYWVQACSMYMTWGATAVAARLSHKAGVVVALSA